MQNTSIMIFFIITETEYQENRKKEYPEIEKGWDQQWILASIIEYQEQHDG